jgi:hypothetical protein
MLSHFSDALVREHQADLLRDRHFRHRPRHSGFSIVRMPAWSPGRVRRAIGRSLIHVGMRLQRPNGVVLELVERPR